MIEPGYTLNERYQLKKTLGEGGMANVYLAHDLILDRDVAVKVLRLDLQNDSDAARRFQREAMATSELVHANIVSIYDVGESHGQQYLVMEYIPGSDLKKYIVEHFPIPYQRVIEIMAQILSAVQLAHDHHIIHRDLKPQNILIDAEGNAKISDFGIAVALADNSMTQTNSLLGSVHYLSPEQARGGMPTRQSDIYALGIILFEMLTGTVPFEGDSAVSIALKHFQEEMPSVRQFDPRIPQALENVVLKATTKVPADRYTSAAAMASDLQTALAPQRAHEPRFVPEADDLDETKVLPIINAAKEPADAPAADTTKVRPKATPKSKKNWLKQRWPFVAAAVAVALIVIGIVVALSGGSSDVTVPTLRNMTTQEARTALAEADLKLGEVTRQTSKSVAKNRVIKSSPAGKTVIKARSAVNVVLSTGQKRFILDDYTGQDYDDVAKDLRAKGFKVRRVHTPSEFAKGEIISQDRRAGKRLVPAETTIVFTVSSGNGTATSPYYRPSPSSPSSASASSSSSAPAQAESSSKPAADAESHAADNEQKPDAENKADGSSSDSPSTTSSSQTTPPASGANPAGENN